MEKFILWSIVFYGFLRKYELENVCYNITISKFYPKHKYFKLSEKIEDDSVKAFHYIQYHSRSLKKTLFVKPSFRHFNRMDYTFNFGKRLCKENGYDSHYHFMEKEIDNKS